VPSQVFTDKGGDNVVAVELGGIDLSHEHVISESHKAVGKQQVKIGPPRRIRTGALGKSFLQRFKLGKMVIFDIQAVVPDRSNDVEMLTDGFRVSPDRPVVTLLL
jgi:hypothetical protein